ncbi:MAG TPA: hypothetical protein VKX17_10430 [Planctomycetota bacterium]|nr:hypothetical protein [Planctomycetota bacterium]
MRKVAVARCAFVVMTLSMLAASGADKTVTKKEKGFEISFPESWTVDEKIPGTVLELAMSVPNGIAKGTSNTVTVDVRVTELEEGATLDRYKDSQMAPFIESIKAKIELLKNKRVNKFEMSRSEPSKLSGIDAVKVSHTGDDNENVRYTRDWHFIVVGKRGYTVCRFASKENFDKHIAELDAIVKSFKLIEAK